MTKKLEELLNLPPLSESTFSVEQPPAEDRPPVTKDQAMAEVTEVMTAISNSERIDLALTTVTGLLEHDNEMDDIAAKAMNTFTDLCDLGNNVPDIHTGKIYEVAATMLKTAMEAKDAKVTKKLKMIDLQLKKMKIDGEGGAGDREHTGNEFDRNELLRHIVDAQKSENSDK